MTTDKSHSNFLPIGLTLFLVVFIFAIYSQVSHHEFIGYDDTANILANPHIATGLNFQNIKWAFTNLFDGNYIPLNWISHMAAIHFFGLNAGGHLLVNVVLHIINTLLLLMLLKKMTDKWWPSFIVAALFALHPLHVESVAWVSARKDVLSGFFWFLTCLSYVEYVKNPTKDRYFNTIVFFVLGLLSKPVLVVLPIILLLFDYWPLRRFETTLPADLFKEKIPFLGLAFISACLTVLSHGSSGWINDASVVSLELRVANALLSYVKYLQKMIWPMDLAVFYPYEAVKPLVIKAMLSLCFIFVVTFAALKQAKNRPYLFVGWFWYLIGMLPVIGIVSFAGFSMADRFTYLPLIGVFMTIGWEAPHFFQRVKLHPLILRFCLVMVIFVCSVVTFFQIGYWKTTETLFTHAYQVTKNNFIAHIQLGDFYTARGDLDLAASHYEMAIVIRPDPNTMNNLGSTYFHLGRRQDARRTYETVVRQYPYHVIGWANLGLLSKEMGDLEDAGNYYAEALRLQPDYLPAYGPLAEIMIGQGRQKEVTALLSRALQRYPNHPELEHWLRVAQSK